MPSKPDRSGGESTSRAEQRDPPGQAPRKRELRDPKELRALAHPVRLAILEQLLVHGSATATQLAEGLQDESPANCSWHLHQLARYGFIEEAGTGPGRQRRWRVVPQTTTTGPATGETPELVHAADAADEVLLSREIAALRTWRTARRDQPGEWRDASFTLHSFGWLTPSEMAAFQAGFEELLARHPISHAERLDRARRPADARPVRLVAWLIPHQSAAAPDRSGTAQDHGRMAESE
jgi:DNA-binding transcriptional ArsR family regulator